MQYVEPYACPECSTNLAVIQQGLFLALSEKGGGYRNVCVYDILYVNARDEYAMIYYFETRYSEKTGKILLSRNLGSIESSGLLKGFVRVHRGYMVNLLHIVYYCEFNVKLRGLNDIAIPVGRTCKASLDAELGRWRIPPQQRAKKSVFL